MGHNFLLKGEYRASLPYTKAALELNPNDFLAGYNLSLAYINLGRFDEAESVIRQMEATNSLDGAALSAWVALHAARSEEAEAHEKLERVVALYDATKNPFLLGFICGLYLRLGNIDEGIDWCERAVDIPSGASGILAARFYRDPVIWNNPSIQALLKKMNLDDASVAAAKAAVARQ